MPDSQSPFRYPYTIGLHDTDAAGVIFAANLIRVCHHAFSAWMEEIGYSIGRLLKERPFGVPIAHIEGDFLKPLTVGDRVEIRLRVANIGNSSYRVEYELITLDGVKAATAAMVHVCIDGAAYRAVDMPADFRERLEEYK